MHDRKTYGAGKPVQNRLGSPRAESEPSRAAVESKPPHASGLGVGENSPSRENIATALANPVPQRPQFFNFDAQAVRVVGSADAPWFVAKDVCAVLELEKTDSALRGLDDDEKGAHSVSTLGGDQKLSTVNESGLYALIFRSRKPQARIFRRWITGEVIPSIRRTGSYSLTSGPTLAELATNPTYLPLAAGHGSLALLPRATGAPVPDLATEHVQQLLSRLIGEKEAQWIGRMPEIAEACVRWNLFFWLIRDAADLTHRSRLGLLLSRRAGINYLGYGQTHLQIRTVGRNRHRKYVIVRLEGGAA